MTSYNTVYKYVEKKFINKGDKADIPYITHLTRVASKVKTNEEKILALLHDVLEDTETTTEELKVLGISDEVIEALLLMTHDKAVPYEQYLQGICKNKLARTVKLADVSDNMDPERLKKLPDETKERLIKKYSAAIDILNKS